MPGSPVAESAPDFYHSVVDDEAVFYAQTAMTGVAPGTAIGTTAAFALHNPVGSEVDLVVLELYLGYISGTLGAGVVSACVNVDDDAAIPTGTAVAEINAKLGNGTQAQGRALTTATLPATPSPIRPLWNLGASLASTALAPSAAKERIDGAIVIPPGCTLSLQGTAAAGSTPLVVLGALWKEENRVA